MVEYIERKDAIEALIGWETEPTDMDIEWALNNIPAADVEPVKHGRWEWCKDHWECTNCRGGRFHDLALGMDASYCGRCGACMDGEEVLKPTPRCKDCGFFKLLDVDGAGECNVCDPPEGTWHGYLACSLFKPRPNCGAKMDLEG